MYRNCNRSGYRSNSRGALPTRTLCLVILLLLLFSDTLTAQMFSVDEQSSYDQEYYQSSLGAGLELGRFQYRGDAGEAGNDRYDFDMSILRIHFESSGINMYFGIGGRLTGSDNQNYLNLGALLYNDFRLAGERRPQPFQLFLPLQLNTDLLRTSRAQSSRQFQQTSFQAGGGLGVRGRLHERLRMSGRIVPNFGFTSSQGAFFGGSLFSLESKIRFHLLNIAGDHSLVAGYDFRYRRYNIDPDLFDYDLNSHTITLGFTF
ncbi:MAG: hypothetical protein WD315_02860 [Balneolaceae bacterium]